MPLIRNGEIATDPWTVIADDEACPPAGDVIVSFERLAAGSDELGARAGRLGVALPNTADPRALAPLLPKLALIALRFPAFTDGRAYSQASILRRELGFEGEIRATGQVLADQGAFMARCGFDTFETDGRQPLEIWRRAARSVTLAYQRDYGDGLATRRRAASSGNSPPDAGRAVGYDATLTDLAAEGSANAG